MEKSSREFYEGDLKFDFIILNFYNKLLILSWLQNENIVSSL
ncbi:hypothetical protein LIBAT_02755 [Leptospira interrogans]